MDNRVDKALQEDGLGSARLRIGENYLPCPRCSHRRKKKKSPCLKLKVEHDGYVGKCWHCGDTFSFRVGQGRTSSAQVVQGKSRPKPGDFGAARRRQRYGVLS